LSAFFEKNSAKCAKNFAFFQTYVYTAKNDQININMALHGLLTLSPQLLIKCKISWRNPCFSYNIFLVGFLPLLSKNGGRTAANFPCQSLSFLAGFETFCRIYRQLATVVEK
jgi:hypothetical protein